MPTFMFEAADWQGSITKERLDADTIDDAGVLGLALAVLLPLWNLTTLFRP